MSLKGKICERAAMHQMIKPGEFYLGDRNYGADFALFDELNAMSCGYVLRLRNEVTWEVVENNPLSPESLARGVTLDAKVRLGHRGAGGIDGQYTHKRMMELLQWHQLGEVGDDELVGLLAAEEAQRAKRTAKKKS